EAVQGAQRHGRIGVVGRIRHRRIERQVRRALQQQVGGEGDDTAGGIEAGGDDAGHRTAVIVVDRWYVYRAWAVAAAAAGGQCDREQTDGEGLQDSHVETPWCDVLVIGGGGARCPPIRPAGAVPHTVLRYASVLLS